MRNTRLLIATDCWCKMLLYLWKWEINILIISVYWKYCRCSAWHAFCLPVRRRLPQPYSQSFPQAKLASISPTTFRTMKISTRIPFAIFLTAAVFPLATSTMTVYQMFSFARTNIPTSFTWTKAIWNLKTSPKKRASRPIVFGQPVLQWPM